MGDDSFFLLAITLLMLNPKTFDMGQTLCTSGIQPHNELKTAASVLQWASVAVTYPRTRKARGTTPPLMQESSPEQRIMDCS
ncbi:hypothetical protein Y032_0242g3409 [Ancylostoma ceylanicum]|uniref:Uncharacterized protein n=1 Tax=Ancylostoma ceylanicum TaxID=53326 RepID=A0A016SEJ0_9BILA|nr:hypothetical protein Y032_0242g3409 [Ancylostoma ceylanicum]